MAGFDLASTTPDTGKQPVGQTRRRAPGRVTWVGGLCLAAVWSLPAIRILQGDVEGVVALLPELLFGTASFVIVLALWRSSRDALVRERLHAEALREELEVQREAVRTANERLVERSQELTEEVSRIHRRAERAEESNRRKSEFLANVGQDVRTAVDEVLAGAQVVLDASASSEITDAARRVRRRGRALLDVIDDVLDYSAIEAERIELTDESFELRALVETTLTKVATRAFERDVELACMIDPELPRALRGDRTRVRQILLGLVGHALRTTEHGEVRVRVDGQAPTEGRIEVRFEVTDDGAGIPADRLATIFEDDAGSGSDASGNERLGLLICARLARLMGGDVGASSREGSGSTFWFTVPLRAGDGQALRRIEKDVAGSRVLVVSGSSSTRLMCIQQLRECGCVPAASADGPSALASLRAAATAGDPFRLVLSDPEVPGGTGLGFAEAIAREDAFGTPRVAVMVPRGDDATRAQVDEADGAIALAKPIVLEDLHELVVEVLRGPAPEPPVDKAVSVIAPAIQAAVEKVERTQKSKRPPVKPRSGRILVVDDNPVNRRVASLMLKRAGYPVELAEDGQIAVERIEAEPPFDLILMDVHMPRLNGFEATARIRSMDPSRAKIPIVAMTASAMSGDAERCLQEGMDGYVSKPVKADALVQVVESWIPEDGDSGGVAPAPTARADDAGDITLDPSGIDELRALAGGDDEMLQELLASFHEAAAAHVATMREALTRGDRKRLAESAHGLRGSAGTIGAKRLHGLTSRLEEDAREEAQVIAPARVDCIEAELAAVRAEIERHLNTSDQPSTADS